MKKKNEKPLAEAIVDYVKTTKGLKLSFGKEDEFTIHQHIDGKFLTFKSNDVEEVLHRKDSKGDHFIQINFYGDKKIILTSKFIGFKPFPLPDLDMKKFPKVVTTPDLLNFIEIIEDSMYEADVSSVEIKEIKGYFEAVMLGAEKVGFELLSERACIERLFHNHPALQAA